MLRIGLGPRDYGSLNCFEGVPGFEHVRVPNLTLRPLARFSKRVRNVADASVLFFPQFSKDVDLLHTFNLAVVNKLPWVTSFESLFPRIWDCEGLKEKLLEKAAGEYCRALLALSENARLHALERNHTSAFYAVLEKKIQVVYPGIEDIRFLEEERAKEHSDVLRVIFVGNDFFRKGGHLACLALEKVKKNRAVEVDFVSTMSEQNYMEKTPSGEGEKWKRKILDLGFHHYANLSPQCLAQKIAQAHILLLPTLDDSFGYSVIEAMRGKTVPLASAIRAIPEMITHGENGLLLNVPITSEGRLDMKRFQSETLVQDLVEHLSWCAQHRSELSRMANAARSSYEIRFQRNVLKENLTRIYSGTGSYLSR